MNRKGFTDLKMEDNINTCQRRKMRRLADIRAGAKVTSMTTVSVCLQTYTTSA